MGFLLKFNVFIFFFKLWEPRNTETNGGVFGGGEAHKNNKLRNSVTIALHCGT